MRNVLNEPRYTTYAVVNAHTGEVHSLHPTRKQARAAKDAAGDHALRVRGHEADGWCRA